MKERLRSVARQLFWKLAPLLPAKLRLKILFRRIHKVWPDLAAPRTFSEKVQWRKLHDRRAILTQFADKYRVRDYIEAKIGAQHLTRMYWSSEDARTLPFDELPDRF